MPHDGHRGDRLSALELAFRPLGFADLPLLQRWLWEPHVVAWWNEPLDLAAVEAKYGPRITGDEPTRVFVIESERDPIGWIQWYRWADYPEHAGRLGAEPFDAGLDLAIGDAGRIGRGFGSRAIAAFLEQVVFPNEEIAACVVDPDERNARSIRAFKRAGFERMRSVHLPGEPALRAVLRRSRDWRSEA